MVNKKINIMEKLTLENIAPYSPTGVKFKSEMDKPFDEHGINPIHTCNGIIELFGDYCLNAKELNDAYAVQSCKPILRPMDLTKPITVDGKEIVPIVEMSLYKDFEVKYLINDRKKYTVIFEVSGVTFDYSVYKDGSTLSLREAKWLYAHKFDLDGLIEKGLAINVNDLKENPYE